MEIKVRNNNGRCLIRFTYQGRRRSKTLGDYNNRTEKHEAQGVANRIADAIENRVYTGHVDDYIISAPSELPSLKESLNQANHGYSGRTYTTLLNKLNTWGEVDSPTKAAKFVTACCGEGSTYNRYLATLKAVRPDLFGHIQKKSQASGKPDPFTVEQSAQLLEHFKPTPYYKLVYSLMRLGLRPGELKGLELSDFHKRGDSFYVSIERSYVSGKMRPMPKNKKARNVYVSKEIWTAVKSPFLKGQNPYRRQSFTNFRSRYWVPALEELGIKYRRLYCLRHTAISLYLQNGGAPLEAAKQFGTSIEVIQNHYADLVREPKPL